MSGETFVTGHFTSHAFFMDDPEYARILDCVVVACVDAVLLDPQGRMLIGKRSREPQPDDWIIGGRMQTGQTFEEAARKNIERELSIKLESERYSYVGTYNLVWSNRAQAPVENGCYTVSITMTAKLT